VGISFFPRNFSNLLKTAKNPEMAQRLLVYALLEDTSMAIQQHATLLDLIQTVNESAKNDEEAVATVAYLINSGRVRLCGNFAGAKINTRPPLDVFLNWVRSGQMPAPYQVH
jgi:hypothetical protein